MQKSYFRGWPIIWVEEPYTQKEMHVSGEEVENTHNGYWVYEDTKERIPAAGGNIRPCKKCGKLFPLGEGEVDPCLGVLSGADNACCGHGIRESSYIRFVNGVTIEDFVVKKEDKDEL